ncbi:MAG: ankyrin repeat domain-containing protein [Sulfuricella denitrificans]|nr:ankyrin repeat domain-containing protein [Sulfuricella denitrificans]
MSDAAPQGTKPIVDYFHKLLFNCNDQTNFCGEIMSVEILQAIAAGDVNQVQALLRNGANCEARDESGATLLIQAAAAGNHALAKQLIEAGADVNAKDTLGWTALMKTCFNDEADCGFPDITQALIDAGADIEAQIVYGTRPLMLAAGRGEARVVEVLLKAGADVLATNEGGRTALMMVKEKFYVEVINQLHEAEMERKGEGSSCGTKLPPGSNVVTFLKQPDH